MSCMAENTPWQHLNHLGALLVTDVDWETYLTCCGLLCVQEELDTIRREQEDLLVLVTDQDSKMSEYRRKLRAYGEDVTEDEDDEDEEGDFAISENFDDDLDDIQWHALFSGHDGLGLIAGGGEGYVITPNYLSFITWSKYT